MAKFVGEIRTKKLNRFPGDTAVKLTKPATSVDGTRYAKGSVMQPLCGGYSNELRSSYCELTVLRAEVV